MKEMQIFIMTHGRCDRQSTYWNLSDDLKAKLRFVVQAQEADKFRQRYPNVIVLPTELNNAGIGKARQWVCENYGPFVVMLDDDLEFAVRRADEPTKFRAATHIDVDRMFELMYHLWEGGTYLVGVAAREGANRNTSQFQYTTRQMRIHGVDTTFFRLNNIRYDRIPVMEDFDVILQFLEKGEPNTVINGYVSNQHGSNITGGCSTYRTPEMQRIAAESLALYHPGFVKVVQKTTKTSWGGGTRYDVVVQWKKAYEFGVRKNESTGNTRVLDQGEGADQGSEGAGATEAMDG